MSVTLSSQDQKLFTEALRAMVSLDVADPAAWESAVLRALKPLLRAERGGFFYAGNRGLSVGASDDYDSDVMQAYHDYYRERDPGRRRLAAQAEPIFSRAMLFRNGLDPLVRSECYNDFLLPYEMGDSTGMRLPRDESGWPGLVALHRRDFGSDEFAHRAPALMRMLYPAFSSGWQARQRLGKQLNDLADMVDALSEAGAVYDADGRLLHASQRALDLIATAPPKVDLRSAMARAAAAHGALLRTPGTTPSHRSARANACPGYRIRATLLESLISDPVVLVTVESTRPRLPSTARLVERFGLTRRQAEVALLLAQRLSTREIAERLVISQHTALRHVEAVRAKLRVRDRRLVAERIREADDGRATPGPDPAR